MFGSESVGQPSKTFLISSPHCPILFSSPCPLHISNTQSQIPNCLFISLHISLTQSQVPTVQLSLHLPKPYTFLSPGIILILLNRGNRAVFDQPGVTELMCYYPPNALMIDPNMCRYSTRPHLLVSV